MDMVDIVMATYNGERYLKEQVDSIIKNTYTNWRLFLCDDGSKDGTEKIAMEYQETCQGQIFWCPNKENKGVTRNFLDGAKRCDGDYVMFCDQDDVWLPNKIEESLKHMKQAEKKYGRDKPLVVFSDATVVNDSLNVLDQSFHQSNQLNTNLLDLPHMLMENKMMGCSMMFNKALQKKLVKLPKHARMHDWWIGLIAAAFGKIIYLDKPLMLYRQHGGNEIGSQKFSIQMVLAKMKKFAELKKAIHDTIMQAKEFYAMYHTELEKVQKKTVYEFSKLGEKNFFGRRVTVVKYRFLKSGMVRNIGLLLVL